MKKLSDQQEYERANDIKKRIRSLDLLHQEQSFKSSLISLDLFTCVSRLGRTGICILSVRDGKIRGTKTHYLKGNQLNDVDSLFQSLIFSYYQSSFSLPDEIFLTAKPSSISLLKKAVKLKFGRNILISTQVNSNVRKVLKLAQLNANQVIENRVNEFDKYSYAFKNIASFLGLSKDDITIEGFDVSHHGGKDAVASSVRFSNKGPDKSKYRLFNIPKELAGNDIGSLKHVLERRIKRETYLPLPDIFLIDGGKAQLNAALSISLKMLTKPPMILSIVKGSKRVRSTETILSINGIVEMPKESTGFILLQQIRDESHRFAISRNRKLKNKSVKRSELDTIDGIGQKKKKALLNHFKSIKAIKTASIEELCLVNGISIKIAKKVYNLKY